jgi:hypothetical protein
VLVEKGETFPWVLYLLAARIEPQCLGKLRGRTIRTMPAPGVVLSARRRVFVGLHPEAEVYVFLCDLLCSVDAKASYGGSSNTPLESIPER